jgi:hypothetical protein
MAGVPGEAECAEEVGWGEPILLAHLIAPGEAERRWRWGRENIL